jgi:hypothetical protein
MNPYVSMLALLAPQSGDKPTAPLPEFVPIGGIVQIVNDDAITAARLERSMNQLRRRYPVTTKEEFDQLLALARQRAIEERLQTQAGENMGLDAAEVEHRAKLNFERRKEKEGLQTMAGYFAESGLGAGGARENLQDLTYQASWFYSEIGEMPGVRGRFWRDSYVRPGELHHLYERSLKELGEPDKVVLQLLDAQAAAFGGLDQAREALEEVRAKVTAGESFDKWVDELSDTARSTLGVQPEIEVSKIGPTDLRAFARVAEVGQVSEPLPWVVDGVTKGWRLVKFVERRAGKPAPAFEDAEMQNQLRKHVQNKRKEYWLGEAGEQMLRSAWTWPRIAADSASEPPQPAKAR